MNTNEKHFMIDFETMGVRLFPVVGCVAIIPFDPFDQWDKAEEHDYQFWFFKMDELLKAGYLYDSSTVSFWGKIKDQFWDAGTVPVEDVDDTLNNIKGFIAKQGEPSNIRIWSRGQEFDFGLFKSLYETWEIEPPFAYNSGRDLRTLMDLVETVKLVAEKFPNTAKHNPIMDCRLQVRQVQYCYNELRIPSF